MHRFVFMPTAVFVHKNKDRKFTFQLTYKIWKKTFSVYYTTNPLSTINGGTCKICDKDWLFSQRLKDDVLTLSLWLVTSYEVFNNTTATLIKKSSESNRLENLLQDLEDLQAGGSSTWIDIDHSVL